MSGTVPDAALLDRYAPVFAEIGEHALDRERERTLPFEQIRLLQASGFTALRVPAELGGGGATIRQLFLLLTRLAAADPHVPQALRGHFAFVEDRLAAAPGGERDAWLRRFVNGETVGNAVTEVGTVAVGRTATRLRRNGDRWSVTGRKYYTTGSIFAEWIDATASDEEGHEYAALLRRDQAGVTVLDDWDGFGQGLTGTGTAVFEDAVAEHVYDFADRFPTQTAFYQLVLVAVLAGISAAVERDVVAELQDRARVFSHGTAAQSRRDPQLLEIVGRISASAAAAEAIVVGASSVLEAASTGAATKRDAELAAARAQVVVGPLAIEAASALFDPLGASATGRPRLLDRHWRNARTVASHNPAAFKARIVGDALVNDAEPPYEWAVGVSPARNQE
ncbi:acyl-CoA dehydrogenase family protein [Amnibacterium sp. CER49]|uniref:acyl-CoA dehydrogenase family protein n=1 Tax=Amnibacterium sp. CER49 TaxID=3039161 RepID=UPI002446B6AD|nr:acyl-CoA dehydrogenase family protein [Amnibacterium sp. CER49]MDH2442570.1 acyl-CoA dehydrogenase family protein [Amnibacterium sp. CER49]